MDIIAGESRIPVHTVYSELRFIETQTYPAMRVRFNKAVSDEEITSLLTSDWHLVENEDGVDNELSVQVGYNQLEYHELSFIKINAKEIENNQLKADIAEVSAIIPQLLAGKKDDTLIVFKKFIPNWTQGEYVVGDVRNYNGQPKTCCSDHDSTKNPDWNPTVASLWSPYHAQSAQYALPWIAPTGAQDIYKTKEFMRFTDGIVYECLSDTNFSPIEYAAAWQKIS